MAQILGASLTGPLEPVSRWNDERTCQAALQKKNHGSCCSFPFPKRRGGLARLRRKVYELMCPCPFSNLETHCFGRPRFIGPRNKAWILASFSASVAVITTAPAPSPKRTQVFRSDQSTQRDKPKSCQLKERGPFCWTLRACAKALRGCICTISSCFPWVGEGSGKELCDLVHMSCFNDLTSSCQTAISYLLEVAGPAKPSSSKYCRVPRSMDHLNFLDL